jgi:hypothetical protein
MYGCVGNNGCCYGRLESEPGAIIYMQFTTLKLTKWLKIQYGRTFF